MTPHIGDRVTVISQAHRALRTPISALVIDIKPWVEVVNMSWPIGIAFLVSINGQRAWLSESSLIGEV